MIWTVGIGGAYFYFDSIFFFCLIFLFAHHHHPYTKQSEDISLLASDQTKKNISNIVQLLCNDMHLTSPIFIFFDLNIL